MKTPRLLVSASLALAALLQTAPAEVFPILQDAAASPSSGNLKPLSGSAKTLAVSSKSSVFINFAVGSSGIDPATVTGARLVLFLPKASATGTLSISNLGGAFTEKIPASPVVSGPTLGASLATIDFSVNSLKKNYATIDITNQVKLWLGDPTNEFGVAIVSDGTASATLASKEGAAFGHPAYIEVDVAGSGSISTTSANFTGPVGIGTTSPAKLLDVALSAGGVPVGSSVDSSISLNLVNTATSGTSNSPNVTGIGFGNSSVRQAIVGGTFGADFLDFYTGGDLLTPKMRIDFGGNISVGTTIPGDRLHVNGSGGTRLLLSTSGSTFAGVRTRSADHEYFTGISSNSTDFIVQDNTAGVTRLRLLSTGNLGIGTNTPGAALDVRGDIKLGATSQLFAVGAGENLGIVRGAVGGTLAAPSVDAGSGFSVARTAGKPVGVYTITFSAAFSGDAIATATTINGGTLLIAAITDYTSSTIEVSTYALNGTLTDANFMFIATGPK